MNVEARLRGLGLEIPEVPKPVAEYVPAKRVDELSPSGCSYRRPMGERSLDAATALERGGWEGFGRGLVTGQVLTPRPLN